MYPNDILDISLTSIYLIAQADRFRVNQCSTFFRLEKNILHNQNKKWVKWIPVCRGEDLGLFNSSFSFRFIPSCWDSMDFFWITMISQSPVNMSPLLGMSLPGPIHKWGTSTFERKSEWTWPMWMMKYHEIPSEVWGKVHNQHNLGKLLKFLNHPKPELQ